MRVATAKEKWAKFTLPFLRILGYGARVAGHYLLFLVLQKAASAQRSAGIHRIRAMVDVLDHSIFFDDKRDSVSKQAAEIQDAVRLCCCLFGVAEDGKGRANLPCELPVAFRPVDADPQDLRTGLLEPGDISLIRLEFFGSTRRARPYVKGQDNGLPTGEVTEPYCFPILVL